MLKKTIYYKINCQLIGSIQVCFFNILILIIQAGNANGKCVILYRHRKYKYLFSLFGNIKF